MPKIDWLAPGSAKPGLIERREVRVLKNIHLDKDVLDSGYVVNWQTKLETPPGKENAILTGDHYFGLGMRHRC